MAAAQVFAADAVYPGVPALLGQKGPTHSLIPWERNDAMVSSSSPHAICLSYRPS